MAELPIRQYGDPVLRERSRELTQEEIDSDFRELIQDMAETMYSAEGVGLAANQIGETRRFFVADVAQTTGAKSKKKRTKDPKNRVLLTFLNPEILESCVEDDRYQEGCLSIPTVEEDVYRPLKVKVRYRTLDWDLREEWIEGFLARVFQHELDHLDGVLFVDHLPEAVRKKVAGALNKLKKETEAQLTENSQSVT